jgi:hypothetical protein
MLASALGLTDRLGRRAGTRLQIERSVPGSEVLRRPIALRGGDDAVVVTRQRSAARAAQAVWDTWRGGRVQFFEGSDALVIAREESEAHRGPRFGNVLRVFHVIGDLVGTDRDVRLRLSEYGEGTGRLEDVPHLAEWAARAALCVVQANVVPRLIPRQASDRRDSENLRDFATELHRHGARRVVTVPPLTPELAVTVLRMLRPASDQGATAADVLSAVTSMRVAIEDANLLPADDAAELAWDVCLFQEPRRVTPWL